MGDLPLVKMFQGLSQGSDDSLAMIFRSSVIGLVLQVVVQRYSVKVFHNDVQVVVGLHHVQDFNDVGVVQHLQYSYFPPH